MRDSFATRISKLPGLSIKEPVADAAPPVSRRKPSPTAPSAMFVPKPAYCHMRPNLDDGTLDSRSAYGAFSCSATTSLRGCCVTVSKSVDFKRLTGEYAYLGCSGV